MSLQFVVGPSGAGKSRYVQEEMIRRCIKEKRNFIMLVPDQFTMQTQKDLCTIPINTREGIMNVDVLSFSRLTYRIMEELGAKQGILLDDTGKNLILRRVAGQKKDELTVIGKNLQKIGYIHEVKSMISEFYQYDIKQKELEELIGYAKGKGALQYKLRDLQIVRDAFASYIEGKYITTEETLDYLCEILPKSQIMKDCVVVLDGFTGFTPIQNRLIRQLMRVSGEMIVTLLADNESDLVKEKEAQQDLFALSRHTYKTLEKIAKDEKIERKTDVYLNGSEKLNERTNKEELIHLEKNLFREKQECFKKDVSNIKLYEATNPREEVKNVLVQIQQLVQKEGYAYRDIAVVSGDMSRYSHLFTTQFAYYGVPLFMDANTDILAHPMSEFLRSLLNLYVDDFSVSAVMRFMRCGLVPFSRSEKDLLEQYITHFGIRGRKKYESVFIRQWKDLDELSCVNDIRTRLMELIKQMSECIKKEEVVASKVIEALHGVCVAANLQEVLEQKKEEFENKLDLKRAREYAQVYRAVVDLFSQMHELLLDETMQLSEFVQVFEAGLYEITIGSIPQNVDQVVVGDIERTRLKQVKALFFVGINDGVIPRDGNGGGLLSVMEREFLMQAGHELAPTPRQQIFRQRLYLYMNMTKPSERLYLSYARCDNEGKGIRKSYLIGTLCKMFCELRHTEVIKLPIIDQIASKKDGLDDFATLMREYASGQLSGDESKKALLFALFEAYKQAGEAEFIENTKNAAFYRYVPESISAELAKAIYGEVIESSVGRIEHFSACAFSHFMQYGMKLRADKEYEIAPADIGNMYHELMQRFSEFLKQNHYQWKDFPMEEATDYVEQMMDELAISYEGALFYDTAGNKNALDDMKRVLIRSIQTMRYQLSQGLFEPKYFEVPFKVGDTIQAKGRIDRIDSFEKDGITYLKVVDYKSSDRSFDPVKMYFGLEIQLAVYLKAAVAIEKEKHKKNQVVPAAMVYYQLQDPYVEMDQIENVSISELEEKIYEQMRPKGLINASDLVLNAMDVSDSDKSLVMHVSKNKSGAVSKTSQVANENQLQLLMDYADYKMRQVGQQVYSGEASVSPYEYGGKNACEYCGYKSVCHFDSKIDGYATRKLDKMSAEEAWIKMEEEMRKE